VGTLNILEAIRFSGEPIKFYNAASSEVFGDTKGAAADESTPFSPRSPSAVAKATAFWEVANYREADGLFACSGILFNHDSPLRPERFVTQKIVASAVRIAAGTQDKLYLGNIDIQRDWSWAEDYVEAMYLMLQQEEFSFRFSTGEASPTRSVSFREEATPTDDYVIATGESYKLAEIYPPPLRVPLQGGDLSLGFGWWGWIGGSMSGVMSADGSGGKSGESD
jgi:GDPmannose 4,6-dehydratase